MAEHRTPEEQKKKQAEYLAKVAAERDELKRVVESVLSTDNGKRLFRYIAKVCGFHVADRVICADGRVDLVATALNSERRNVYLNLRALASADALRIVEHTEHTEETI